jgi:hypothetical protein
MDIDEKNTYATVTSVDEFHHNKFSDDLHQADLEQNKAATNEKGFVFNTTGEKVRFGILMTGTLLAMFMMSLNSTVVAPAVTIIATDLNAVSQQTWIATAYLVAVNAFQPLSGKVSHSKLINRCLICLTLVC